MSEENQPNSTEQSANFFRAPISNIDTTSKTVPVDNTPVEQIESDKTGIADYKDVTGEPFIANYYSVIYKELPESERVKMDKVDDYVRKQIVVGKHKFSIESVDAIMKKLEQDLKISELDSYQKIDKINSFLDVVPDHKTEVEVQQEKIQEVAKKTEEKVLNKVRDEKISELKEEVKTLKSEQQKRIEAETNLLQYKAKTESLQQQVDTFKTELKEMNTELMTANQKAELAEKYSQEIEKVKEEMDFYKEQMEAEIDLSKEQQRELKRLSQESQQSKKLLSNLINV
jgi:chromosome segregation ATPase